MIPLMRNVNVTSFFVYFLISELLSPRFLCSECVDEMHNLGFLVRAGASTIRVAQNTQHTIVTLHQIFSNTNLLDQDYLAANYCPTVEAAQQDFCVEKLARYYIGMLVRIIAHTLNFVMMTLLSFESLMNETLF